MSQPFSLTPKLHRLQPVEAWGPALGDTHFATKGSYSAGEVIKISILVKDSVVLDACFQAHGSGHTIICCSAVCKQLIGKAVSDLGFDKQALATLCELPREKYQVLLLLEEALTELKKKA